jgi:hypothetical protein
MELAILRAGDDHHILIYLIYMKYFFLSAIAIALVSCSKDDPAPTPLPAATIDGKWYPRDTVIDGVVYQYDDHEACGKDYIEFYGGNRVRSVDILDCEPNIEFEGLYSLYTNLLAINDGVDAFGGTVTLTYTTLVFSYAMDENEDGVNEQHVETYDR